LCQGRTISIVVSQKEVNEISFTKTVASGVGFLEKETYRRDFGLDSVNNLESAIRALQVKRIPSQVVLKYGLQTHPFWSTIAYPVSIHQKEMSR